MKAILHLLHNDAKVTALVNGRITPNIRDRQGDLPAVTVKIVGNDPSGTKSGASTLDRVVVEVISYAATYRVAEELANKCRIAIERKSGTQGVETIQSVEMLDEFTDYEEIETSPVHYVERNYRVRVVR